MNSRCHNLENIFTTHTGSEIASAIISIEKKRLFQEDENIKNCRISKICENKLFQNARVCKIEWGIRKKWFQNSTTKKPDPIWP